MIGIGHLYRMLGIARELAVEHHVLVATNGGDVPNLPFPPDVVMVEFYPFERWEFEPEILELIEEARRYNPRVHVFCSVRDIVIGAWYALQMRSDTPSSSADSSLPSISAAASPFLREFQDRVVTRLNNCFDALLVHSDPNVISLEYSFGALKSVRIPVHYTGYIASQTVPDKSDKPSPERYILVSVGGGLESRDFLRACAQAWSIARQRGRLPSYRMLLLAGARLSQADFSLVAESLTDSVTLFPFRHDFPHLLVGAAGSISRGGYNTVVDLLQSSGPALVVPSPQLADQVFRARRFSELELLDSASEEDFEPAQLADQLEELIETPRARHRVKLDGGPETRRLLERICEAPQGVGRARAVL